MIILIHKYNHLTLERSFLVFVPDLEPFLDPDLEPFLDPDLDLFLVTDFVLGTVVGPDFVLGTVVGPDLELVLGTVLGTV